MPITHEEVDQICQISDSNCNSSAGIVANKLCNSSVYNLDIVSVSRWYVPKVVDHHTFSGLPDQDSASKCELMELMSYDN